MSEGAWARKHEALGRGTLRAIWILAAMGCAFLAARAAPGGWGALAGAAVALVPVGITGSQRLEPWALAAFFLMAAFVARRRWLAVLSWAAVISLTPVGLPAAAAALAAGRREDRIAVLLSLPVWLALDPTRLTNPGIAIPRYFATLLTGGWPGIGNGPLGRLLVASWTPGIVAAALGIAGGVAAIASGDARLRAAAAAVLVLWVLPAAMGARRPDGVGLASPIALVLAACGVRAIVARAARMRAAIAIGMAIVLLVPIGIGNVRSIQAQSQRRDRAGALARLLGQEVGRKGLLLRDPLAPPAPDSVASFALPTHVEHPETFDFAWWPGWYGSFTHALFTVRTLDALHADARNRPASVALLGALTRQADQVAVLGDPETDRTSLVLFRIRPGAPWMPDDRDKGWESVHGGKIEAHFLADLAGFLEAHGKSDRAVELLRLAMHWDAQDSQVLTTLGSTLIGMGEWKQAIELLEPAMRGNGGSVEMRYTLARAYLADNVPARAELELRQVLSARPTFAAAHYQMARAAAAAGHWALAAEALEAYLSKEPNPANRAQIEEALAEARRRADAQRAAAQRAPDGRKR